LAPPAGHEQLLHPEIRENIAEARPSVHKTIALLPADGIGPEVTAAAAQVLQDCAAEFGHRFELQEFPVGGGAIDSCGAPLPP
jgi:3-isopropylmalate dehydrogenase